MNQPTWRKILRAEIKADSRSLWTVACPWLQGPGLIKIEVPAIKNPAEKPTEATETKPQTWSYSGDAECTADGDLLSALDQRRGVLPTAPIGALIGRIGGSTADAAGAFAVGRLCVRELPEPAEGEPAIRGPLLLTINDVWAGFDDNRGSLQVDIFIAPFSDTTPPSAAKE